METLLKNRLLFWILIFLIIVNLSALATYFFFPKKQDLAVCAADTGTPGCVLHAELDLTQDQIQQVDKINANYQEVSKPISEAIKNARADILDELASEAPDTLAINQLSLQIANWQRLLHRENIKHYLELKKVCTADQAMRLSSLYRELYGCPLHGQEKDRQRHRHADR